MPYIIVPKNGKFVVKGENGKIHSKHTTKAKANAQVRLLHAIENGWQPTKGR